MSNPAETARLLEAVLFFRNEPVSRIDLSKELSLETQELEEGLSSLRGALQGRGVALVDDGSSVELRVAPAFAPVIEKLLKESLTRDLGKAGLETLAIVLYKGPSTKAEIEFIRGVNSSYILRALSVRGLLRRIPNPKDERSFLYEPTGELLSFMGATRREDLPEWEKLTGEIQTLLARKDTTPPEQTGEHHD